MDAIADRAFENVPSGNVLKEQDETPSLLTVILDLNPLQWRSLKADITLKDISKSLLVMLNSHLSLNSSNTVAVLSSNSYKSGAQWIYPKPLETDDTETAKQRSHAHLVNPTMYRGFRIINDSVLEEISSILDMEPDRFQDIGKRGKDDSKGKVKGTLVGALSMALTYINRVQNTNDSTSIKSRILIVSTSDDLTLPYISMMNCTFAAQKMKVSIDVCKLGTDSTFLQQACDSTNGVYMYINHPSGLIQYLTTALFIDPSLRPIMVLPTNTNIDFRASCFLTSKIIDIGFVCSVCLCILSIVPHDEKCPICHSQFDPKIVKTLKAKPRTLPLIRKKRKLDSGAGASEETDTSRAATPAK
ncbi:unnamed protein product [Kuraishia capsulata CBS 1993]|uniref:General transcription and DNA repair factor IIH subunit TFB4 n=1 Tax=Kuraishia capsulata CBS 1993 TaxID=1382522 RepID=W6MI54_9ASCO|nr:uncharacterized protein KUCA_T00001513001 [Kuraishia capsulata CBS 1993]CDK25543.1 unnamed protein product [Kuraishia capsulata CBS 1993]